MSRALHSLWVLFAYNYNCILCHTLALCSSHQPLMKLIQIHYSSALSQWRCFVVFVVVELALIERSRHSLDSFLVCLCALTHTNKCVRRPWLQIVATGGHWKPLKLSRLQIEFASATWSIVIVDVALRWWCDRDIQKLWGVLAPPLLQPRADDLKIWTPKLELLRVISCNLQLVACCSC